MNKLYIVFGQGKSVNLTDHLFPIISFEGNQIIPVLLRIDDSTVQWWPIFSTIDKLRALMAHLPIEFKGLRKIDDGSAFLTCVPFRLNGRPLEIAVDPEKMANGKVRYTKLVRK